MFANQANPMRKFTLENKAADSISGVRKLKIPEE
jgi:hypothetical protein